MDDEDIADARSLMSSLDLTAREAACIVVDVRHGYDTGHPHTAAHEAEVCALMAAITEAEE